MSMNAFLLANDVFSNLEEFSLIDKHIDSNTPVDEVIHQIRLWFRELSQADGDSSVLRKLLWQLKTTLQLTLLPFDSPELKLEELLLSIREESQAYPILREKYEKLEHLIKFMLVKPDNQKGAKILNELRQCRNEKVGIVLALTRWKTPGWSENALALVKKVRPDVVFIQSKTQLKSERPDLVILPGNARYSPLLHDLMSGAYCSKLLTVYYKEEGFTIPKQSSLPASTVNIKPAKTRNTRIIQAFSENKDEEVNNWFEDDFWVALREKAAAQNGISQEARDDNPFFIDARLVLLADGSKVFLEVGHKVTEISSILEGTASVEDYGKSLPYKHTEQLSSGDLVVLRTEGGGDYIAELSDAKIESDGKREILQRTQKWKSLLDAELRVFGEDLIYQGLVKRGSNLSSSGYIKMWPTNHVIGPGDKNTFRNLLETMFELDSKLPGTPRQLCELYWSDILEIRRYRIKAGHDLRRALLAKLRYLIEKRVKINDRYSLNLSEHAQGAISVFRVSAVDEITSRVPYYRAGVVIKGENPANGENDPTLLQ